MERWLDIWEKLLWADGRVTACGVLLIAVLTVAEQIWPAEPSQGWQGRGRNALMLLQYKLLGLGAVALWYALGPGPIRIGFDPLILPAPIWILANLLTIDFFFYWYHRLQHHFRPLWAIHELHHADTELNASTSYRTYWLEALVQTILVSTPTAVFFGSLGSQHAIIVLSISVFLLIFTHSNLRLPFGPVSAVVCGPQVHRIHHSRLPGHRDRNFAQFFPFLDLMFGTYKAPQPGEYPPTGADDLESDASLVKVLTQPMRIWSELVGGNTGAKVARGASVQNHNRRTQKRKKRSRNNRSKRR